MKFNDEALIALCVIFGFTVIIGLTSVRSVTGLVIPVDLMEMSVWMKGREARKNMVHKIIIMYK